jgi:hypothetical protein
MATSPRVLAILPFQPPTKEERSEFWFFFSQRRNTEARAMADPSVAAALHGLRLIIDRDEVVGGDNAERGRGGNNNNE